MLSNRVLLLQLSNTRAKSNFGNSLSRQSKIFSKLFGNRIAGSKKRWYPSTDVNNSGSTGFQPPSVVFQASQFGKSGRNNASGPKQNTRRMSVLNKLFMAHITDLLATGEAADIIVGRGLQISLVKTSPDFSCVNVYWIGSGNLQEDAALETDLQRCSGMLRHELSQLRLMGEVPRIKFLRDKSKTKLHSLELILQSEKEKGEVVEPLQSFDVTQTARYEFYGNSATCPVPNESGDALYTLPEMRHDVLGLDHRLIMSKVLRKMMKSKQAWDRSQLQQDRERSRNDNSVEKLPLLVESER
ncbi:uncharacterized protein LOC115629285 [Scaptodrosophila lebanonensis]|uniref:Uncharacterized protein LOC115629285 n=1 Tax=Drosophila lebanonensis TaxID=7225 RepID=A0A6J2U107_DROLE|nr:uncharacterized protein LOC115629285 [Scaptodrosophila lebanonensis]